MALNVPKQIAKHKGEIDMSGINERDNMRNKIKELENELQYVQSILEEDIRLDKMIPLSKKCSGSPDLGVSRRKVIIQALTEMKERIRNQHNELCTEFAKSEIEYFKKIREEINIKHKVALANVIRLDRMIGQEGMSIVDMNLINEGLEAYDITFNSIRVEVRKKYHKEMTMFDKRMKRIDRRIEELSKKI